MELGLIDGIGAFGLPSSVENNLIFRSLLPKCRFTFPRNFETLLTISCVIGSMGGLPVLDAAWKTGGLAVVLSVILEASLVTFGFGAVDFGAELGARLIFYLNTGGAGVKPFFDLALAALGAALLRGLSFKASPKASSIACC